MTVKTNSQSQSEEPTSQAGALESIREQLEGKQGAEQTTEATETDTPPSDKVKLTIGEGVVQEVDAAELASLWASKQDMETQRRAAEALMNRAVGAKGLADQLDSYPPEVRDMLIAAIQNPQILASQPAGKAKPKGADSEFQQMVQALKGDADSAGSGSRPSPELSEIRNKVNALMAYVNEDIGVKKQATMRQTVEQAVESFDVFRGENADPDAKKWAIRTAMAEAANGGDPQKAAAEAAAFAHRMALRGKGRPASESPDWRGRREESLFNLEKAPSADDLGSGDIASRIQQMLAEGRGN